MSGHVLLGLEENHQWVAAVVYALEVLAAVLQVHKCLVQVLVRDSNPV